MPNVSIKLLREGAKLPVRGSASAAGYDLYACLDGDQELTIPPHSTAMLLHAVDSYVTPEPWAMPGYESEVISKRRASAPDLRLPPARGPAMKSWVSGWCPAPPRVDTTSFRPWSWAAVRVWWPSARAFRPPHRWTAT